jgi:hypothetical protein
MSKTKKDEATIDWSVEHNITNGSGAVISTHRIFGTAKTAVEAAMRSRHALATLKGEDSEPPTDARKEPGSSTRKASGTSTAAGARTADLTK